MHLCVSKICGFADDCQQGSCFPFLFCIPATASRYPPYTFIMYNISW
jgi:hypothetical protein